MLPTDFQQSNFTFGPPQGTSEEDCGSLKCYRGKEEGSNWPVIISAWKMSAEEKEEFDRTGIVWLRIYSDWMYPVGMSAKNPWGE